MPHPIIQELEKSQRKAEVPEFNVGDTVEVRVKIREGEKERIQPFIGTVIAKRGIGTMIGRQGTGSRETFTVRRLVQGEGVERVFPLHSPNIVDVRVRHEGKVRRAKLYYLRDRIGKATRIKGRVVHEKTSKKKKKQAKVEAKTEVEAEAKSEE